MKKLLLFFSLLFFSSSLWAQGELIITSEKQTIDYEKRLFVYSGKVKATWKDLLLEAQELKVYLDEKNVPQKVVAKGKVKISQKKEKRYASCELAVYTSKDSKVTLEGNPHYWDGMGNDLVATKLIIWLKRGLVEAEGKPVKAVYYFKEGKSGPESGKSE